MVPKFFKIMHATKSRKSVEKTLHYVQNQTRIAEGMEVQHIPQRAIS